MDRRRFVSALAATPFWAVMESCVAGLLGVATPALAQNATQDPDQLPGLAPPGVQPPAPGRGVGPWPDESQQFPSIKMDRHSILVENQKNIQKDVNQLYDLAGKLKKQVSQTDTSEILSLDMLNTTDEIEKLAKHIKDLAKD